ncbi:MAG: hypothetical protein J5778_09965 [Clostridiales bacterium]|nr:hypothetical protein [Clostridiales bacterium]
MRESNILLTSLGDLGNRLSHSYFYFEDKGLTRYCDGISIAEAGAKYIMSSNPIDEIIVLGSPSTFKPGEEGIRIPLKNYSGYSANNIDSLSEYGFFLYRLLQFQTGVDMEGIDVLEQLDPARKEVLIKAYDSFLKDLTGDRPDIKEDEIFHYLAQDIDLEHDLYSKIPDLSRKEIRWLKRYIYTRLSPKSRLSSLDVNDDLLISFIPSDRDEDKKILSGDNITNIVRSIYKSGDAKINLYVDMQGLETSAGYSILAVLQLLSNEADSAFEIREIITSHRSRDRFASPIDNNEMARYKINTLLSGMEAFIRYGKVSIIENYWKSTGIRNDHIDSLINAMRWVDDGISLCNIPDLEYGIALLKEVFKAPMTGELPEFESNVFLLLERGIKRDYGDLLKEDELNCLTLICWAQRKKFYQQCLTIIESRIPAELVERGIFYYWETAEDKDSFLRAMNYEYYDTIPRLRYCFRDLSHHFVKYHARSRVWTKRGEDISRKYLDYRLKKLKDDSVRTAPLHSLIEDHPEELDALIYSYYTLGFVRNSINHADPKDVEDIDPSKNERIELVDETISDFIAIYEKVTEIIKSKGLSSFRAKTVTYEEFRDYRMAHKLFITPNNGLRNQSRRISIPEPKLKPGEKLLITLEIETEEGRKKLAEYGQEAEF